MNISPSNISVHSSLVRQSILNADLIALDLEFSGLPKNQHIPKTIEECIIAGIQCAQKFSPLQLGLCTFQIHGKSSKPYSVIARPFNFYIKKHKTQLLGQNGSINFLKKHNFDFKMWMSNSFDVSSRNHVLMLEKRFNDLRQAEIDIYSCLESPVFQSNDLLLNSISSLFHNLDDPPNIYHHEFQSCISPSKYLQLVRHLHIRGLFVSFMTIDYNSLDIKTILVEPLILPSYQVTIETKYCELFKKFQSFHLYYIFDLIQQKKPCITAHNSLLDWCYLMNTFIPHSLEKCLIHPNQFPKLFVETFGNHFIDTRFLWQHHPLNKKLPNSRFPRSRNVEKMCLYFKSMPNPLFSFVLPDEFLAYISASDDSGSKTYHEAAFDAYETGQSLFLSLPYYINAWNVSKLKKCPVPLSESLSELVSPMSVSESLSELEPIVGDTIDLQPPQSSTSNQLDISSNLSPTNETSTLFTGTISLTPFFKQPIISPFLNKINVMKNLVHYIPTHPTADPHNLLSSNITFLAVIISGEIQLDLVSAVLSHMRKYCHPTRKILPFIHSPYIAIRAGFKPNQIVPSPQSIIDNLSLDLFQNHTVSINVYSSFHQIGLH